MLKIVQKPHYYIIALITLKLVLSMTYRVYSERTVKQNTVSLSAADEKLIIPDSTFYILEDRNSGFSCDEVLRLPSEAFVKYAKNTGVNGYTYWTKFSIVSTDEKPYQRLLELEYPPLEFLSLIYISGDSVIEVLSGAALPFDIRKIKSGSHVFEIPLQKGVNTFYFKIKSPIAKFPVIIHSNESFKKSQNSQLMFYSILFGIILFIMILNVIFYFQTKDFLHLSYVVYIFISLLGFINYIGLGLQYIWPDMPWWNKTSFLFFLNFVIVTHIIFAIDLLNLKKFAPLYRKILLLIVFLLFAPMGICSFVFPSWLVFKITIYLDMLLLPLALVAGYIGIKHKHVPTYYYLAGCVLFTLSVSTTLFRYLQKDPVYSGVSHTIGVAMVLEIILFSIAIGIRVKEHLVICAQAVSNDPDTVPKIEINPGIVKILTPKELEVLENLFLGLPDKEIARQMEVSVPTVKTHLKKIFVKLEVRNRTEAVIKARYS